jgi:3-methyladenine DNA glycosylase AlkD
MAKPAGRFDASHYFRGTGDLGFFNIKMPVLRAFARTIVARQPAWTIEDAMVFAGILLPDRVLEVKAIGIEVVARYRRSFTPRLLRDWKRWLERDWAANWATTDAICGLLIGPLVAAHPELVPRVTHWAGHRNLWVRRAAAVGLLPSMRAHGRLDAAYAVARRLHGDPHDLIQKAAGWLLREAGKIDPVRLERYLRAKGRSIPRTTIRYAIERMSAAKRREILELTRPPRSGIVRR